MQAWQDKFGATADIGEACDEDSYVNRGEGGDITAMGRDGTSPSNSERYIQVCERRRLHSEGEGVLCGEQPEVFLFALLC